MQRSGTVATEVETAVLNPSDAHPRTPARAYVLLRALPGTRRHLVETLAEQPGVVTVDVVEGPLDIVLVIEGPDRTRLARNLMKALASVETEFDGLEMLPAQRPRPVRRGAARHSAGGPV